MAITCKNDAFSPSPPDAMLMSGIQVIFVRLNIAGEGWQKNGWNTKKQHCQPLLRGGFQSLFNKVHFFS